MKKVIIALTLCLTFGMTFAFADTGASEELYAKRCAKCHGRDGAKTSGASGGVMLKGQSADEIKTKLMGYKEGTYGGKRKKTMQRMVKKLTKEQLADLACIIGNF